MRENKVKHTNTVKMADATIHKLHCWLLTLRHK